MEWLQSLKDYVAANADKVRGKGPLTVPPHVGQ